MNLWILAKDVVKINLEASDFAMWSSYADSYSIVVFWTVANSWWCSSTYYTNNWNRFRYHMWLSNRPYLDCAWTQSWTKNTIEYTLSWFTVNWVSWSQIWTDSTRADASNSAICFWYCGNNSKSKYKMYSLKITTNTWEKIFVPCFRKADWAVWLFELSEGEFYANVWTGRFLMWRDIAYLPKEYEQVEYVLNTTWDEYVDLWIVSNNSLKVSLMITPTQLNTDNWFIWWIWSANDFLLTCYNSKFRFHNGWNYIDTASVAVNNKYNMWLDNTWILVNENRYWMNAGSSYGSHNLWIYHIDWQTNTNPRVKFYALRVWNQWEFVRDYVPCIRKSDGVIWFYDLVNETFHTNQGGGAFVRWRIYSAYEVNSNTLSYFPLCDEKDVTWNRTLTLWNVTFPDGYANVNAASSYLLPTPSFWWSVITVSLFYYCQSLNSNSWNTLLCRNTWTYHHLLISWGNSDESVAWKVWFYNNGWVGGNKIITPWKRYHFVVTKNWTNEKIYVNGELALDSDNSRDNSTYGLSILWWHSSSSWNQWSIWKLSEFIAEDREWTQEEIMTYLDTMKDYYWIS